MNIEHLCDIVNKFVSPFILPPLNKKNKEELSQMGIRKQNLYKILQDSVKICKTSRLKDHFLKYFKRAFINNL